MKLGRPCLSRFPCSWLPSNNEQAKLRNVCPKNVPPNTLVHHYPHHQWIGGKIYGKTPWSSWEILWFPVKNFPTKPIHWHPDLKWHFAGIALLRTPKRPQQMAPTALWLSATLGNKTNRELSLLVITLEPPLTKETTLQGGAPVISMFKDLINVNPGLIHP